MDQMCDCSNTLTERMFVRPAAEENLATAPNGMLRQRRGAPVATEPVSCPPAAQLDDAPKPQPRQRFRSVPPCCACPPAAQAPCCAPGVNTDACTALRRPPRLWRGKSVSSGHSTQASHAGPLSAMHRYRHYLSLLVS